MTFCTVYDSKRYIGTVVSPNITSFQAKLLQKGFGYSNGKFQKGDVYIYPQKDTTLTLLQGQLWTEKDFFKLPALR